MGRQEMDARYDDHVGLTSSIDDFNRRWPPDRCRPKPDSTHLAPLPVSAVVVASRLAIHMMN